MLPNHPQPLTKREEESWAHDRPVSTATKQQTCPKYRAHNRAEEELGEELDVEEEEVDVE